MKSVSAVLIAGACLAVHATVTLSEAASFNCANAKTADEIAICNRRYLSDLDLQIATLYGVGMQIPMLMGARGAAQDEQRAFLTQRGACAGDVVCIQHAYQSRIAILNQTIQAAMQDYCVKLGIC